MAITTVEQDLTSYKISEMPLVMADLQKTSEIYREWENEWGFLQAAYDGTRALVAYGAIIRHERESNENYQRRIDEAYGFSYSRSIVDLFNYYLFKEPVKRELGSLPNDQLWMAFTKDCNLENDELDEFLLAAAKAASTQGHVGILVDKPAIDSDTRADDVEKNIYPYLALYKPLAILDWEFEKDDHGRPRLVYLKLKDDDDFYRIWSPEAWEVWKEPETEEEIDESSNKYKQMQAELVASGENKLGEIPFVWLYNEKTDKRGLGNSDITDISRIDASIIRNLSQGEEIVNYAAFPMMRKPKKERGETETDEVGVTAILEFDPENPESKPDWLEAAVLEPIQAIFDIIIGKKISEIYRSANVGGMAATEIQTQAKSGVALKTEFQLLNSKLVGKGKLLEKTEKEIIRLWLKWMKQENKFEGIEIERSDTYEVENLAQDLENLMTATTIVVGSETFKKKVQKKTARLVLSNEPDDEMKKIDSEIDAYKPPEPVSPFRINEEEDLGSAVSSKNTDKQDGEKQAKIEDAKVTEFPKKR